MKIDFDDQTRRLAGLRDPAFMSEYFIEAVLDGFREKLGFVVNESAIDEGDVQQGEGVCND